MASCQNRPRSQASERNASMSRSTGRSSVPSPPTSIRLVPPVAAARRPSPLLDDSAALGDVSWTQVARGMSSSHQEVPNWTSPHKKVSVHPLTMQEAPAMQRSFTDSESESEPEAMPQAPCTPNMAYIVNHGGISGSGHLIGGVSMSEWL